MIEIPLQAGVENSHQVFDVQLGDHLFGFELDYQYLYQRWLVNIDVDGERLISGSVLAAGSCLNRSADKYGLIYFIGEDATIDNIGKKNSLVWAEKEEATLTNNIIVPVPPVTPCIYEDFVSTRHGGFDPYTWLKLNDVGSPPAIQSDGSSPLNFNVLYENFSLTNNIQFGSPPVINQSGTTSLNFAPEYLEGSIILQSDFLAYDETGPLDTEIEFWVLIGDAPMSVHLTDTSTFISVGYVGGKIVGTVETDDFGTVSVSSAANFSAGDIVHVVAQFYDYGILQDGQLFLYVNGVSQGAVDADGPYGTQFYPPDLTLNVEGDVNTGTPTSIDQLTFYSGDSFSFMGTQTILDTYNCGKGQTPPQPPQPPIKTYEEHIATRDNGLAPNHWFKFNDSASNSAVDSGRDSAAGIFDQTQITFQQDPVITESGTNSIELPLSTASSPFLTGPVSTIVPDEPVYFEFWFQPLSVGWNFNFNFEHFSVALTATSISYFVQGDNGNDISGAATQSFTLGEKYYIGASLENYDDGNGMTLKIFVNAVEVFSGFSPDLIMFFGQPGLTIFGEKGFRIDQLVVENRNNISDIETYNIGISV